MTNGTLKCPAWLYSNNIWTNSTSIGDINTVFMKRNIPGLIFVSVLMVTGIIGNSSVLYIFWTRFKRTNYRTYILWLATVDQISCCVLMPFIIVYLVFPKNFPSDIICRLGHFIGYFTSITSAFLLVLIAGDRYRKICQPTKKQISKSFAKRSCLFINVIGFVISTQSVIIYGTTTRPTGVFQIKETICYIGDSPAMVKFGKIFYIQLQIITTSVIVILAILYSKVMKRISVQRQKSLNRLSNQSFGTKIIKTRKITLTFIVITLIFTVSSEIHHALAMILHFVGDDLECRMTMFQGSAFYLFLWTVLINNATNPFIYGVADERFRKYFKQIINRGRSANTEWNRCAASLTE